MLEEIRKRARSSAITSAIIFLVIAAGVLAFTGKSLLAFVKGPELISKGTDFAALEGEYVSFVVEYPLEYYVEETERNSKTGQEKTTGYGFVVYDDNNGTFFGVDISVKDEKKITQMEKLLDEAWMWLAGESEDVVSTFEVKGTLQTMDSLSSSYFKQTVREIFEDDSMVPETLYCIRVGDIKDMSFWGVVVAGAVICLFVLLFLKKIADIFGNSFKKPISAYLEKNPKITMNDLEGDFAQARKIGKCKDVWLGKRWTFGVNGGIPCVIENSTIVWAYYYKRTGRYSESKIHYYLADKSFIGFNIAETEAKELLGIYAQTLPQAVIGYDENLRKTYNKDYEAFLNLKYKAAQSMEGFEGFDKF